MEAPPPALPVELVEEILLRLPPDEPACILRASLVCKSWGSAVSRRSFRRRLHELYPAPPVLGFFHDLDDERISHFIPTTASSFSLPAPDRRSWRVLDCRHGRALFLSNSKGWGAPELLVWEPVTGSTRRVPLPPVFDGDYSSEHPKDPGVAVFCAADACDHRDCHGGPFQVVFVLSVLVGDDEYDTLAGVYSSETDTWGEPTWVHAEGDMRFSFCSSVLVRTSLLYFMSDDGFIVEYYLARHGLAVFGALGMESHSWEEAETLNLVLAEDGGMRVSQASLPHLKFWKREASDGPDARWVLSRVINLGSLLQIGVALDDGTRVRMVGFAEGANAIFVDTVGGIFTIELQLEKVRKVCDENGVYNLIPVVGFYTPVPRDEHQAPLSWGPSEEACGEEGGEDKKAVEQPQQLFDEGSNAIEEEGFDSVGFSHAEVVDYAVGENAIFVHTLNGLFTIELQSDRARKVCGDGHFYPFISSDSFYNGGEHQVLLDLNPREEAASEERGAEEEKTIAIEKGDSANALECVDHALKIRIPSCGEVAPECSSTVYKHGCAFGSRAEDSAPPSEKGDCAEGEDSNGNKKKH